MPTILEEIYAQRAKDVRLAKSTPGTTPADLKNLLAMHLAPSLIPLVPRLKRNPSSSTSSPSPSLMAEIKRASPSKGPIALSVNPAKQAQTYALSGASVISVLTEPTWFKGSLLDMRLAREAVDSLPDRPAILRKDFIFDEYQIDEARLHGADTVLLIVAMLSLDRLEALYAYSLSLGMEPLVEVNNAKEMKVALELGAKVIGVNNRNLHDFQVDMGTTSRLVELVREMDVVLCALSGISSAKDVNTYKEQGVRAVLVGESLMRAKDTRQFIRELLSWPQQTLFAGKTQTSPMPWVKVTGVQTKEEAKKCIAAGADMISVIFDTTDAHHVSPETAREISAVIREAQLASKPSKKSTAPDSSSGTPIFGPYFTLQMVHLITTPHSRPLLVGIFKNQSLPTILSSISSAHLDLVQLNGTTEPPEWFQHIPVPVIRRFAIDGDLKGFTKPGLHAFSLLDQESVNGKADWGAVVKSVEGGGGEADGFPMPVILDMELPIENLGLGIRNFTPWATDIKRSDEGGFEETLELVRSMKSGQ